MTSLLKPIQRDLRTRTVGRTLHEFAELVSTNDWAMERARTGTIEGEVVIAACQTSGKGRLKRQWFSPDGGNLYMSIILKPAVSAQAVPQLTLVAGAAVSDALSQLTGKRILLKWPNDLIFDGRKIGGILCEAQMEKQRITAAIIGIGINVQMDVHEFPEDLQKTAASLKQVTETPLERGEVAVSILNSLEQWYDKFLQGSWTEVVAWYNTHNALKGDLVELISCGDRSRGYVEGIDEKGRLLLKLESGEIKSFLEGDLERLAHVTGN